jgi:D-3-phosphoglycerate dehydrogenase
MCAFHRLSRGSEATEDPTAASSTQDPSLQVRIPELGVEMQSNLKVSCPEITSEMNLMTKDWERVMSDHYIASTEKLPPRALMLLKRWDVKNRNYTDEDLARADVLIGWEENVTSDLIRKAKKLRVIQTLSAGVNAIPFRLLRNVRVFSNPAAFANPVAEHAWALILGLAKNINRVEKQESYQVYRLTLLVIGCGGIGSKVAEIGLKAFGMRTIGVSRSFYRPRLFDERHGMTKLTQALSQADVIVSTLPLTRLTEGILDYDKLARTKQGAIIVNVGRGNVMREADIYRLLVERPRTRFGTDVFWIKEGAEVFESKLWELDNFMGTPHQAGAVKTNRDVFDNVVLAGVQNLTRYLRSGTARNEVRVGDYL